LHGLYPCGKVNIRGLEKPGFVLEVVDFSKNENHVRLFLLYMIFALYG
jgi:hypothetical protein